MVDHDSPGDGGSLTCTRDVEGHRGARESDREPGGVNRCSGPGHSTQPVGTEFCSLLVFRHDPVPLSPYTGEADDDSSQSDPRAGGQESVHRPHSFEALGVLGKGRDPRNGPPRSRGFTSVWEDSFVHGKATCGLPPLRGLARKSRRVLL